MIHENLLASIQFLIINHPLLGPFIFIFSHIVMAILLIPCSPMTFLAGFLWGAKCGLIISLVASIASTSITFYLSRTFLRDKIYKILKKRYIKTKGLLKIVSQYDWKIVATFQINPFMPSASVGYLFGLTKIKFFRYLISSLIFMIPLQILFVVTGYSLLDFMISNKSLSNVFLQ